MSSNSGLTGVVLVLSMLSAAAAQPAPSGPPWYEEFRQPETRAAKAGLLETTFTARFSQLRLRFPPPDNDMTFYARIYENMVPGPTLRMLPGDKVRVLLINKLIDPRKDPPDGDANFQLTNLHTHGWHVDPKSVTQLVDGKPYGFPGKKIPKIVLAHDDILLTVLPPGWKDDHGGHAGHKVDLKHPSVVQDMLQYEYDIPGYHAPGTHWYHAHRHGSVSKQTENGMAGALIIEEPPGHEIVKGIQEKIMIIQDITNILVKEAGTGQETLIDTSNEPGTKAKVGEKPLRKVFTTINGVFQPTIRMSPGEIQRWRVINAGSNTRAFSEIFVRPGQGNTGKNLQFYLIARDGITLSQMQPVTVGSSVFLGPGNRADFLIQAPVPAMKEIGKFQNELNFDVGANLAPGIQLGTNGYNNAQMASVPQNRSPLPLFSNDKLKVGQSPPIARYRPVSYTKRTVTKKKPNGGETTQTTFQYKVPRIQSETILGHVQVSGVPLTHQKLPPVGKSLPGRPPGADYLRDIADKDVTNTRTVVFDVAWVKTDDKKNVIKPFQYLEGDVSGLATRRLTIDSKEFGEPNSAIDVPAGTAEEWTVINNSDQSHPFHIHVNPFQIVEIKQWMHPNNDPTKKGKLATPKWAPIPGTWMDTITLPPRGYARFRSRFADKVKTKNKTYDFTGSFVLHCHILNHEDGGMMVVVNVRPKKAVASRRK
ncbi:MAG: multicopper oxidase domain-containing protein [Planctomycetota bacterium]|nr:multicopper oxidase domain-containing protein [Planctomycetota bacterium]